MTSTDASTGPIPGGPRSGSRLRIRRPAAVTGAAFVAWLTVLPLAVSLIVERPFLGAFSAVAGLALMLVPVAVSLWAWRSGIDVTREGIAIRGIFSSRTIAWKHIDGFAHGNEGVAAILDDQSQVRLHPLKPENLPQVLAIGGQDLRTGEDG